MLRCAFVVVVLAGLAVAEPTKGPTIQLNRKGNETKATFDVAGLDKSQLDKLAKAKLSADEWAALFAVYVELTAASDEALPAMSGSHRVDDGVLRFEPRFPLTPGVRYKAVFEPAKLPGATGKPVAIVERFSIPKPEVKPTTVVAQVYPTRAKLPENQLKFYLHFSAPMSKGEAYRRIQLLDAAGKVIEVPFLELDEELWSPDLKRLTLLVDPGRVKRGLASRDEEGPVFEKGKSYTLVIDAKWSDAEGNPLKETFKKKFTAVAADETPIDPKTWKLQVPKANQSDALSVDLGEPLDHALLNRLLTVVDARGQKIAGKITITDEETRWHFTPEKPWQAGAYELVIDTVLEDLAGNSVGKPFELDVFNKVDREVRTATVKRSFEIK